MIVDGRWWMVEIFFDGWWSSLMVGDVHVCWWTVFCLWTECHVAKTPVASRGKPGSSSRPVNMKDRWAGWELDVLRFYMPRQCRGSNISDIQRTSQVTLKITEKNHQEIHYDSFLVIIGLFQVSLEVFFLCLVSAAPLVPPAYSACMVQVCPRKERGKDDLDAGERPPRGRWRWELELKMTYVRTLVEKASRLFF